MTDASPPAPDLGVPPPVPGYRLRRLLGRGGSGEVWEAEPRTGGDPVAVKVLVAGDPERQAREAALLGELDHPHLVRLLEVVHQPRLGGRARVALVLELLEGGSLAALIARRGRLRPGEVVTALAPVAAALAHAHDQGVVHGDLSPGNVVFTGEGRPVLTDLGVARVIGDAAAAEVTPAYVDPTVARGGAPGPSSDVFGVAAAAFHALTGVAPWNGATPADVLAVAAAGELPDLAALAPEAPEELLAVVRSGLAEDPHDRPTAAAFALDLRHACIPEPVRLARAGAAGEEPGGTGARPRTELTAEVPGRRPRPAPVVRARRGGRGRVLAGRVLATDPVSRRRAAVVLLLGAVLAGAVWLGGRWGADAVDPVSADPAVSSADRSPGPAPASSAAPSPSAAPSTATPASSPPSPGEAASEDPVTPEGWADLLAELYDRRAQAFGTAEAEALDDVYTPDSPLLVADRAAVAALAAAGEVLGGFAPEVVEVRSVAVTGDRAVVEAVDRRPEHAVLAASAPDGPPLRMQPGRAEAAVRLELVRTPDGWRIAAAALGEPLSRGRVPPAAPRPGPGGSR
ncbi:serine/threonine-protein kinase [Blastococcus sp. SYSU D00820]